MLLIAILATFQGENVPSEQLYLKICVFYATCTCTLLSIWVQRFASVKKTSVLFGDQTSINISPFVVIIGVITEASSSVNL